MEPMVSEHNEPGPPHRFRDFDPIWWKYALWKCVSGPYMSMVAATPAVVIAWHALSGPEKVVALIGLSGVAIKAVDLLFDQTMARLAQGKPPAPIPGVTNGGHTETHHKTPERKESQ